MVLSASGLSGFRAFSVLFFVGGGLRVSGLAGSRPLGLLRFKVSDFHQELDFSGLGLLNTTP